MSSPKNSHNNFIHFDQNQNDSQNDKKLVYLNRNQNSCSHGNTCFKIPAWIVIRVLKYGIDLVNKSLFCGCSCDTLFAIFATIITWSTVSIVASVSPRTSSIYSFVSCINLSNQLGLSGFARWW